MNTELTPETGRRPPFRADAPWLAPLAGWSDLPFRLLCRERGAAMCTTEMISARGLIQGGRNTRELLATAPADSPLAVQLFGAEPSVMGEAVSLLRGMGFAWFDVNMGCSVPKVTKTGAGAALLKNLPAALAVGEAVIRAAGPGMAGFKLRLGWEERTDGGVYRELALALAERGAGWITLHPRYARQGFAGEVRREAVAELARLLPVPVVASGDLFLPEDGARTLRETGAATVMYARGALADPAIFAGHKALLAGRAADPPDPAALAALVRRHAELARQYAPRTALLRIRTAAPRYVRRMEGAKALRERLLACSDWEGLERVLERLTL